MVKCRMWPKVIEVRHVKGIVPRAATMRRVRAGLSLLAALYGCTRSTGGSDGATPAPDVTLRDRSDEASLSPRDAGAGYASSIEGGAPSDVAYERPAPIAVTPLREPTFEGLPRDDAGRPVIQQLR